MRSPRFSALSIPIAVAALSVLVLVIFTTSCDSDSAEAGPSDTPASVTDTGPGDEDVATTTDTGAPDTTATAPDVPHTEDTGAAPEMTFVGCDAPVDIESIQDRQFVVAPYLIEPRPDSVTIRWEALDDAPSYLLWGPEGHMNHCVCVTDPARFTVVSEEFEDEHDGWIYSVTLDHLKPGARYDYTLVGAQVIDGEALDLFVGKRDWAPFSGATFATPPAAGSDFTVVIYGDNQPFTFDHELVAEGVAEAAPDVVLHTGDIVHNGLFEQYRTYYFPMASPLARAVPHIYAAGNHEESGEAIPFDAYFPVAPRPLTTADGELPSPGPRTGWFDVGAARIFVLDTQRSMDDGSEQLAWLDAALAETVTEHPEITWLFTMWHRPTYSGSDSQWNGPREAIQAVMAHWRVDAVWNGHSHAYERFDQDGVQYIVTGGGGAGLYSITTRELTEDENRVAGEVSHHFVYGTVGAESAGFRAIRATDRGEIDAFTIEAKDRSDLR